MLGRAAAAMWYDVRPEIREEWEDWHTHEHMPERLGIPGFLRGSRWASGSSYFGLYEARSLAVLTGGPYMERLNHPTPWSLKMMPEHRGMMRSICRVRATAGAGLPGFLATLRFSPPRREARVAKSMLESIPQLVVRKGLSAAHLLQSQPMQRLPQTAEQKLRGGDAQADWVLLVGGYDPDAIRMAVDAEPAAQLPGASCSFYRLAFALTPRG